MTTIRAKVDSELTRRIGTWFTVREIQRKLRINPSTLKPLIMRYARERVLKRRQIKGTARSVEFSPAATNSKEFANLIIQAMPYRESPKKASPRATSAKKVAKPKGKTSASKRKSSRCSSKGW